MEHGSGELEQQRLEHVSIAQEIHKVFGPGALEQVEEIFNNIREEGVRGTILARLGSARSTQQCNINKINRIGNFKFLKRHDCILCVVLPRTV